MLNAQLLTSSPDEKLFETSRQGKIVHWDTQRIRSAMWNEWNSVFRKALGQAERTLVSELRDARNKWGHQQAFSSDDAYRAIDSASQFLTTISAP